MNVIDVTRDRRRATVHWTLDKMQDGVLAPANAEEISAMNNHLNHRMVKGIRARLATHLNTKYAIELALKHNSAYVN